jgi:hypothetical protein
VEGVPFRTLATVQVTAFVAIEIGERIASGADHAALSHELFGHAMWVVLLVGIVVQLLMARIGSTASRLVAEAAAQRRAAHSTPAPPSPAPVPGTGVLVRFSSVPPPCRGPPVAAFGTI